MEILTTIIGIVIIIVIYEKAKKILAAHDKFENNFSEKKEKKQ